MTRIDRYIARQFLVNFAVLTALLCSLVVAIDIIVNLGRFLDAGASLAGERGSIRHATLTVVWIVDYWGPKLLQLLSFIAGVNLVAAMGFTCTQLVRRRELVAVVASGVSLGRLLRPFLIVGLLVSAAQTINQEALIPSVAHLLTRNPGDALRRDVKPFEVPLLRDGSNRVLYATEFNSATNTLIAPTLWERDAGGRVLRRIEADSATWDGAAWVMRSARVDDRTAPGQRRPAIAQKTALPDIRVPTDLDPTILKAQRFSEYGQSLSWRQVGRMIDRGDMDPAARDRLDRVRWGRLASLLANLLALVIAAPFYLVREPRNMVAQTLKSGPLLGAALVGGAVGPAASLSGVPVALGVFAATLILAPAAVAAYLSIRT